MEHRLLPRAVALLAVGAVSLGDDGRVAIDAAAAAEVPWPRRALLSVSDKTGLLELARELVAREVELVSTGGTARALREAGLPVTDVADVTGFPEMLDGRVKTVHPRIHAGVLADRRLAEHRAQLAAAVIAPFEFVVVNLYPFEAAAERPAITLDELIEEIDIGGPALVRAAAKNHASVAVAHLARRSTGRSFRSWSATAPSGRGPAGGWPWRLSGARRRTTRRIAAELGRRLVGDGLPSRRWRRRARRCRPASSSTWSASSPCATGRTRTRSPPCTGAPTRPPAADRSPTAWTCARARR